VTPDDLGTSSIPEGFDRITVTGVAVSKGTADSTEDLRELFAHHRFTEGVELLTSGTPTNNHEGAESGYRREEPPEESVDIEVSAPLTGATEPTDGTLLAQCLGLATADDHPFAHVEGSGDTTWLDARHLQSALWAGTLGYTLRHLLVPRSIYEGNASDQEIATAQRRYRGLRDHFIDHVRAGGPFPALRVGDQPYGVLPVLSIDEYDPGSTAGDDGDVYAFLLRMVTWLRSFWEESVGNVPTAMDRRTVADGGDDGDGQGGSLGPVRTVLKRGAVADSFVPRLFVEDSSLEPTLTRGLSNHGLDYDPRLARLRQFDPSTGGTYSEYGVVDYEESSEDEEGNGSPNGKTYESRRLSRLVRPDPTGEFLPGLATMTTTDLIKLGFDPHLERFPGLVALAYHPSGPIDSWDGLQGILADPVAKPIRAWLTDEEVTEPGVALYRLLDRTEEALFVWHDDTYLSILEAAQGQDPEELDDLIEEYSRRFRPGEEGEEYEVEISEPPNPFTEVDREKLFADVLEYVLGKVLGEELSLTASYEDLLAALQVLVVDALDEFLGTDTNGGAPDSDRPVPSTPSLDGTELTATKLVKFRKTVIDALENASYADSGVFDGIEGSEDSGAEWPAGTQRLQYFYEGFREALRAQNLFEEPDGDGGSTAGSEFYFLGSANLYVRNLITKHFDDYMILGTALRGATHSAPMTSFGNAGESAIPTNVSPFSELHRWDSTSYDFHEKALHDTTVFTQVLRYATMHANLLGVVGTDTDDIDLEHRFDDVTPGGSGRGLYALLESATSEATRNAFSWSYPNSDRDVLEHDFGIDSRIGLLNAMRHPILIGDDGVDDRFKAVYANLNWMAERGWLDPDRVDRTRRLFAGTLDLASHRLDAWWTSLATRRLMDLRSGPDDGSFDLDFADAWVVEDSEDPLELYDLDWSTLALEEPTGNTETYVGAYGFVEDLRRDSADGPMTPEMERFATATDAAERVLENADWLDIPSTESGGEATLSESEFIQAPSLAQARTAAILRSGYRSQPSAAREMLDIDLSPPRVQRAQWVLDGLRSGLWLGELVGYYFERRLHEVSEETGITLERYITAFREFAPFRETRIEHGDGDGSDDGAPRPPDPARQYDLVDGYKLYRRTNEQSVDDLLDEVGIPDPAALESPENTPDGETSAPDARKARRLLATVLGEVDTLLDALADLIMAENVYQLQQGNYGQAGRSLKALSEGKQPRQPEVLPTKRDSVGVTHRLLVLFGLPGENPRAAKELDDAWKPSRTVTSPRVSKSGELVTDDAGNPQTAPVETVVRDDGAPILNAFAGELFPDPGSVKCGATYRWETESDDGTTTEHEVPVEGGLSLAALDLSPLDALYITQTGAEAGNSKLENHVAYYLLRHRSNHGSSIPADAEVDVAFTDLPDEAADGDFTFGEFIEHARSLRDLISESRPVDAADLAHPGDDVQRTRTDAARADEERDRDSESGTEDDPYRSNWTVETLADIERVLENRLRVLGADLDSDSGSAEDGTRLGSGTDLTEPVDRVEEALEALDEAVPLGSIHAETGRLSASGFRTELATLKDHLPAGPTAPEEAPEPITVRARSETIELPVPVANADVFVPPEGIRIVGRQTDSGTVGELVVRDPNSGPDVDVSVSTSGDQFEARVDFGEFLEGEESALKSLELFTRGGTGTITELALVSGQTLVDEADLGSTVEVGLVPDVPAANAFGGNGASVAVAVASDSPSSRFRDETGEGARVAITDDGRIERTVDFSGVQVGTRFSVVATYRDDSGRSHVAATTTGRVVGPDPANAIDDELLASMTSLPRLLWLTGFDESLTVDPWIHVPEWLARPSLTAVRNLSIGETRLEITELLPGSWPPTSALSGSGLPDPTSTSSSESETSELEPGESETSELEPGESETSESGTSGSPTTARPYVRLPDFGDLEESGSGSTESESERDEAQPSPVERLDRRLGRVDWTALTRERKLFPASNTTYDDSKRRAVASLLRLESVDVGATSEALTGGSSARGLVPTVERLRLPAAVTVVGRDAPFGEQGFFAPEDPVQLADVRARIDAFLEDPWPSDVKWRTPEWFFVRPSLVAFVQEKGLEDELGSLLALVNDPSWTVPTLDAFVERPGDLVAGVEDMLYHPDGLSPSAFGSVAADLRAFAETANNSNNSRVRGLLDGFEAVSDVGKDVVDPVTAIASALESGTPAGASGGTETFDDNVTDWVTTVTTNLQPLVDAIEAEELTPSLREGLLETLRRPMVRAAYFGIYGAMPTEASGGTRTAQRNLVRQAESVLASVRERHDAAEGLSGTGLEAAMDRFEAVFGENYTVLRPFEPGNVEEVLETFGNEELLTTDDDESDPGPLPVQTWLQRSARVRERPRMLRETLLYGEVATGRDTLDLDLGQLPHQASRSPDDGGDTWVGLDGVRPKGRDRVSLVAHTDGGFDGIVQGTASTGERTALAGLFVDEWTERYPPEEETTSVAVRYDEPDNEPPQSILLATPPPAGEGDPWSLSTLERTIDETLEMMRYRGVDLKDLQPDDRADRWMLGKLLPALYFAQDSHVQPNTPSIDFTSINVYEGEVGSLLFGVLLTTPRQRLFRNVTPPTDLSDTTIIGGDD
jgi:hypothetical protein